MFLTITTLRMHFSTLIRTILKLYIATHNREFTKAAFLRAKKYFYYLTVRIKIILCEKINIHLQTHL